MLAKMYSLCHIYLVYKKSEKNDKSRLLAIEKIFFAGLFDKSEKPSDIFVLAQNFFLHRLKEEYSVKSVKNILYTDTKL